MKQKKIGRRIASFALAMVMLLSYIPVQTLGADSDTDIKAIKKPTGLAIVEDYDDYFGDTWLEKLDLPQTVTVTLADGTEAEAAVTWDAASLDPRTSGYYFLPGEVALPIGATNSQNLDVAITIQVREKSNIFFNGYMDKGAEGWHGSWLGTKVEYPSGSGNYVLHKGANNASNGTQFMYQTSAEQTAAATRLMAEGAGQYLLSIDVMAAPQGANAARKDLKVTLDQRYYTAGSDSSKSAGMVTSGLLSTTEWTNINKLITVGDNWTKIRTDLKSTMSSTGQPAAYYVDNVELIPLKVALKAEPANISAINTQIQSRFVTINYDKYIGENWKESLGLPAAVEVVTDKGDVLNVDVTWNYNGLDVSKYGKYTLIGTLDDSSLPNPKGLTVRQNIYVCKAENLYTNPSFEEGTAGWRWGAEYKTNLTPAFDGKYAIGAKSSSAAYVRYNMFYPADHIQIELGSKVAAAGAGQYYIGAKVRDFDQEGEVPHTAPLQVYMEVRYKKDLGQNSSLNGTTNVVDLTNEYQTTGGVFTLSGDEVWFRTDLYLASETKFANQWILADDMQFIPLNVLIPLGEEPADVVEILDEIPQRAVVQDYDKYAGANWQEALGLPATVKVKTDKGLIADVNVIWDFNPLRLDKVGKYTLVGTLDNSLYPNPNNLYVTQVIYIREYLNLFTNGSFEAGATGWGWGAEYKTNMTPAFAGKYAIGVKSSSGAYSSYNMFYPGSQEQTNLGTLIMENGAGQYYLSVYARDYLHDGEIPHTEPLKLALELRYKKGEDVNSSGKGKTEIITLTDKYQQTSGIFNLDGDENFIRTDAYVSSTTKFANQWVMFDKMELIPLNVIVKRYEGAMEAVETIIPDRNIIQNYPDYVAGYTTADLLFPETVQVRSTKGEIVDIGVRWDYSKLDLTKKGTYTLTGVLEEMKLDNPDALTVSQTVHVVDYQNLLEYGGFEEGIEGWGYSSHLSYMSVAKPKLEGDYSLEVTMKRMETYTKDMTKENWLQAFWTGKPEELGQRITQIGAGRYFFGIHAKAYHNATDVALRPRFIYQHVANGDASVGMNAESKHLVTNEFIQSNGLITIPGDVTWARLDIYFEGTVNEMRLSTLWLDHAEVVPLNVEVPNMTDVIYMEKAADIYVHEGTSVAGLKLPAKLEILLKNTQRFDVGVTWDTSAFDPNKLGEQIITGSLNLDEKHKNPQKFTPVVKVTVRAKGEELRQTIYISTSGDEANDGLSPEKPKKEIKNIASYLKQGYNVRLKRGDIWYLPTGSFTFRDIHGTAEVPVVLGAYGSGGELPTIGFMKKIENNAWTLVDAKRNIYAADVADLGQRNGQNVHRCFVNDEPYCHKDRTNYVALRTEEFCSYGDKLYIRMPEGKAPENVEVTPYGGVGTRLTVTEVSHLTIEYIHFKGSSAINAMMRFDAPTEHLKFQYCSMTHCYYYIMVYEATDERVHYKPEISNCYIDATLSEEEGAKNDDPNWNVGLVEGIVFRDGVDSGWVHHNHIRNMSHAFITVESLDKTTESRTRGVYDCYFEDNLLEGGNALYARAFNFVGGYNLSDVQMCRNNTWRRNRCYDMTTSNHLYGENNLVYSNVFSYVHCEYDEENVLFAGKSAQPWVFDVIPWGDHGCVGNMVVNNTVYDASGLAGIYDQANTVYNNIFANNLIVNWTSDPCPYGLSGALADKSIGLQYVMNNAVYSTEARTDHFTVDDMIFIAEDVNGTKTGYSDNMHGDPKFVNADLTQMGEKGVRLDFTLSSESPFRYAGLSINASVYGSFPAWKRLKAEYTDLNGTVFLAESPSIGAVSFCERIGGEVASVDKLADIVVRTGATYESLPLPDTVGATNDQGIDVVLLIDWIKDGYDASKGGTVTLTGTLRNGPHTELNVTGKTVSVNILQKDKLELKDIVTDLPPVTVFYNTSYEAVLAQLPDKLRVVEESGFEEDLPVDWVCENYNPTKPDIYVFQCILPDDLITYDRKFDPEIEVRVLEEIGRGSELLVNPDFIDGTSAGPWKFGWGTGTFKVTTDPRYLYPGEPAAAIVTADGRYGSVQQDVTGQVKLLGDGKYLFRCYMRTYDPGVTINSSYACLQVLSPRTYSERCRAKVNIADEWVEYYAIMDVHDVDIATEIMFHTSTGKTKEDVEEETKSFVISGCSFIFLGTTDEEIEATLDTVDLTWNTIRGENEFEKDVKSDLTLPSATGENSTVKWTSSDESVITNDGKVTMGRTPKTVTLTATITYNGIETVKKFTVTVPRNPELPTFTGTLAGSQAVNIGDEFKVTISLAGEKATTFNAYRFTLSFNASKLEYLSCSDAASTVDVEGGKITISGIGTERPITDTITLTFQAKKSGITEVKLVKVEMDLDPNANLDNLPAMTVTEGAALIDVQKTVGAEQDDNKTTENSEKDNSVVIWVVIGLAAAALICGGVIAVILIKKKKQTPDTEN